MVKQLNSCWAINSYQGKTSQRIVYERWIIISVIKGTYHNITWFDKATIYQFSNDRIIQE